MCARTALMAALTGVVAIAVGQLYTLLDLGRGGAVDVNEDGYVVGIDALSRPVMWTPSGERVVLFEPPEADALTKAINLNRQVTGQMWSPSTRNRAVFWPSAATLTNLGTLPGGEDGNGSYGYGINDAGQVAGQSSSANSLHAFLWTPGRGMEDLGALANAPSYGRDVNNREEVVGSAIVGTTGYPFYTYISHAFLWRRGTGMIGLGGFNEQHSSSEAVALNDNAVAAGFATRFHAETSRTVYRAVIWRSPGAIQDLGVLYPDRENSSHARDINNHDQVVGESYSTPSGFHSVFVWSPSTGPEQARTAPGRRLHLGSPRDQRSRSDRWQLRDQQRNARVHHDPGRKRGSRRAQSDGQSFDGQLRRLQYRDSRVDLACSSEWE
ncbi:MAG TPA: hypothetical protein VEX38_00825 [Fimbriimonadaceae bacterium]|nr:hypothetical protein [Fimbriimonadaceae bacterium]